MMAGRRRRRFALDDEEAVLVQERGGTLLETSSTAKAFGFNPRPDGRIDVFWGDGKETVSASLSGQEVEVATPRGRRRFLLADPYAGEDADIAGQGHLRAPMPGSVTQILARVGERLARGAPILVMEAMKMEHTLSAPAEGTLVALHCAVGDFVQEGTELAEFEASGK